MTHSKYLKLALLGGACAAILSSAAQADEFNIASGDLKAALHAYIAQTGIQLIVSDEAVRGVRTRGVRGDLTADAALTHILSGTGFVAEREDSAIAVVRGQPKPAPMIHLADAVAPMRAAASVETVVVTSSKIKGDIQTVPIAITALSQEQLTSRQIAGGPDLVKEVPNLTFSKTNFTGYNIQIRGIGTQAISVTTDPAVAVALNDMPFIRNHFFEQEFYDVNQVEVLRGPQGTLYGRNATAGVVNVISAQPTGQFEAMLSADWGNFKNRRYEGMVNLPIVDDRLAIRIAAEWTKRDGYSTNSLTNSPIDGRDLWSNRITIAFKPTERLRTYLVWEHFQEDDDRIRSSKQLCKTAPIPDSILGVSLPPPGNVNGSLSDMGGYFSQGCLPVSLYSPEAFQVPNGYSLPYVAAGIYGRELNEYVNPYASTTQSHNLRVIESALNPTYKAKNNVLEFNADYDVTPELTFTSQTGYSQDFLWSTEDYNRFNTTPGAFAYAPNFQNKQLTSFAGYYVCAEGTLSYGGTQDCANPLTLANHPAGIFCDPQLGCSDRLVAMDLSEEHAWQFNQEFRLASNFKGPFNFSVGGNYLHYETEENYYVFINELTAFMVSTVDSFSNQFPYNPSTFTGSDTFQGHMCTICDSGGSGYQLASQRFGAGVPGDSSGGYVDPHDIYHLDNEGHNYFLSQNPYVLNSYAGFGEAYYQVLPALKLTGGIRWTEDKKHFTNFPSQILTNNYGYPSAGSVDQEWNQLTGRAAANWTPKLDFTDQTLVYVSWAHGYKAGGANPPGATLVSFESTDVVHPIHPLTFKPEFIDAYELGTKNTMLDGALTLNGNVFYYNYKGYQISRIVDRTAINDNFDATVRGAELEATYEPIPGLKFHFAGGYEGTRVDNGQSSIDLMDRTDAANHPGWMVLKPFIGQASNCIVTPELVIDSLNYGIYNYGADSPGSLVQLCGAIRNGLDPITDLQYVPNPTIQCIGFTAFVCSETRHISGYAGFDPNRPEINNGEGFAKDLSGNQLPNAPHFTSALSAEYTTPVSEDWAATFHMDFYWQSQSFARIFNDRPYDKIRGYSTTNVALILTSADGWQIFGYVKNIFDKTAITGDFLNSDDSGLTTNVFLTDPRLFGVRVTKNW